MKSVTIKPTHFVQCTLIDIQYALIISVSVLAIIVKLVPAFVFIIFQDIYKMERKSSTQREKF